MKLPIDTILICSVIVIYFLKGYVELIKNKQLLKELKNYLKIVEIAKKEDKIEKEIERIYLEYEIAVASANFKYIKENVDDYNFVLKEKKYRNVNSEQFFNEINIIERNFNLNAINQKGSTLVGLGVLGTFAGLFMSLRGLGGGADTAQQINMINEIIPGMSMAFLTSLFGMSLSIWYTMRQKRWIGDAVKEIAQINYNLGMIFPTTNTVEDMLLKIEKNIESLKEALTKDVGTAVSGAMQATQASLFMNLAVKLNEGINSMGSELSNRLADSINSVFNDKFVSDFKEVHKGLVQAGETIYVNTKAVETMTDKLPKIISEFNEMNDVSVSIFKNGQKTMEEYGKYMKGTDEFIKVMDKMTELQERIEGSVENLKNTTLEKYDNINEISSKNYGNFDRMLVEFKDAMEKGMQQNTDAIENTGKALFKNVEIVDMLEDKLKVNIEKIVNGIERRGEGFDDQYKALIEAQDKFEERISAGLEEYDGVVTKLTNQIVDMVNNVKHMRD